MRRSLIFAGAAIACIATTIEAGAINRYSATATRCDRIQTIVRAEGAAIFRWTQPPNIQRYGRYVASNAYCDPHELAQVSRIPAADTPSCPVLECLPRPDDFRRRLLRPWLN